MYIRILIVSLIYMLHIAAAETSDTDDTPVFAPEIHAIYHHCTHMSLAELLQDKAACIQAHRYMEKVRAQQKFKVPLEAARWNHPTYRRMEWQSLDKFFVEFLYSEQGNLEASKPADFLHDPDFKGLLIANSMFQQKWLSADPKIFKEMFASPEEEVAASQSLSTPEPAKMIPCGTSEDTIRMYTRGF